MTITHAAAGTAHILYARDTLYLWQNEKDEVVAGGSIKSAGGCVQVPGRPVLGFDIKVDQITLGTHQAEEHADWNCKRVLRRW